MKKKPILTPWLRTVADDIDQQLLDAVFDYESMSDMEAGCCHSAAKIESGDCQAGPPDDVHAVRLIASRYADHPGRPDEWKP